MAAVGGCFDTSGVLFACGGGRMASAGMAPAVTISDTDSSTRGDGGGEAFAGGCTTCAGIAPAVTVPETEDALSTNEGDGGGGDAVLVVEDGDAGRAGIAPDVTVA